MQQHRTGCGGCRGWRRASQQGGWGVVYGCILWLALASSAFGELTAQQIAILANRSDLDSLKVAEHYARRRGVPSTHIIPLDLGSIQDTISRKAYEEDVLHPTRRALEKRGLAGQIRALVTVYGVPLRLQAPVPNEQHQRWAEDAERRGKQALTGLDALARRLQAAEPAATPQTPAETAAQLLERITAAIQQRATRLEEEKDPQQVAARTQELSDILGQFGGKAMLVQHLRPTSSAIAQQAQEELRQRQQQILASQALIRALQDVPSEPHRHRAYLLTSVVFGLHGVWRYAHTELDSLRYTEGDASVDSELSLLWWDANLYRVAGRAGNPLFHPFQALPEHTVVPLPVLMVSRIDAPTPQLAMQLVDRALATEQQGLTGSIYVDARGAQQEAPLPFTTGYFDQSLRDLAEIFRQGTRYPVVLENTEQRFSQPGQAPDVAVYAGWYAYRSYEDAFTFTPGSLGYHIASGEAVNVHDPQERGWCKNALERGITATLGSVGEPYLDAFPLPHEFFGLLLTGRYSLVEAYYLTTRYLSWRMVLFGDPLYNPWRGKGLSPGNNFKLLAARGATTQSLPSAPSTLPFPEPVQAIQQLQQQRQTLLAEAARVVEDLERRGHGDPVGGKTSQSDGRVGQGKYQEPGTQGNGTKKRQ